MQIRELLDRFYLIKDLLFLHLLPSELARFAASIRLQLTCNERRKYLNPIRQLGKYESIARSYIKDKYEVLIIGQDLIELMDELNNPIKHYRYANSGRGKSNWDNRSNWIDGHDRGYVLALIIFKKIENSSSDYKVEMPDIIGTSNYNDSILHSWQNDKADNYSNTTILSLTPKGMLHPYKNELIEIETGRDITYSFENNGKSIKVHEFIQDRLSTYLMHGYIEESSIAPTTAIIMLNRDPTKIHKIVGSFDIYTRISRYNNFIHISMLVYRGPISTIPTNYNLQVNRFSNGDLDFKEDTRIARRHENNYGLQTICIEEISPNRFCIKGRFDIKHKFKLGAYIFVNLCQFCDQSGEPMTDKFIFIKDPTGCLNGITIIGLNALQVVNGDSSYTESKVDLYFGILPDHCVIISNEIVECGWNGLLIYIELELHIMKNELANYSKFERCSFIGKESRWQ